MEKKDKNLRCVCNSELKPCSLCLLTCKYYWEMYEGTSSSLYQRLIIIAKKKNLTIPMYVSALKNILKKSKRTSKNKQTKDQSINRKIIMSRFRCQNTIQLT